MGNLPELLFAFSTAVAKVYDPNGGYCMQNNILSGNVNMVCALAPACDLYEAMKNPSIVGYQPRDAAALAQAADSRLATGFNTDQLTTQVTANNVLPFFKKPMPLASRPLYITEYHAMGEDAATVQADLERAVSLPEISGVYFFMFSRAVSPPLGLGSTGTDPKFGMLNIANSKSFGEVGWPIFMRNGQSYPQSAPCLLPETSDGHRIAESVASVYKGTVNQ